MSQIINAKFAVSYDADNNVTGYGSSPAGEIEFPSDTDQIVTFDNEDDFKNAMQPINPPDAVAPTMKLSDQGVSRSTAQRAQQV